MDKIYDSMLNRLPLDSVQPAGWLLDQLVLVNNLQKRLGAISGMLKNGEWIKGERLPRYVRGLILLAGVLDDKSLRDKVEGYILPILNSATPGGNFGPKDTKSEIPKIEAIKTLVAYYELSEDDRVILFLKKYFKYQYNTFSVTSSWYDSRARLLEQASAIELVYRLTDLEWLQDLAEELRDRSCNWFKLSTKFTYKRATSKYISAISFHKIKKLCENYENMIDENSIKPRRNSKLSLTKTRVINQDRMESEWKKRSHQIQVETDGVNIAKAVKYPATYGRLIGDNQLKNLSLKLLASLEKHHGSPMGMFFSDSHLSGHSGDMGIDVQASCEMIESLVEVLTETGDLSIADTLEKILYNIIPAACSEDMTAVQNIVYLNQLETTNNIRKSMFEGKNGNSYIQRRQSRGAIATLSAYPTFMRALCLTRENELNFMLYAPCTMKLNIGGKKCVIKEETGYPFRNTVVFSVKEVEGAPEVKINFRVPAGTTMQLISGGQVVASGTRNISVKCVLRAGSTFMLKMDIPLLCKENIDNTISLFKGSILMSLKMPYERKPSVEDKSLINLKFTKLWSVSPFLSRKQFPGYKKLFDMEQTVVHQLSSNPFCFEKSPFELKLRAKNVLNWESDKITAMTVPKKPLFSEESLERVFIPFGCTYLNMTVFPKCNKSK